MFYSPSQSKYITEGVPFQLNGVQYPANWLNVSTPEEKEAAGLVEVTLEGSPGDDRFYWVSSELKDGKLVYTNTPKDLDELKTNWKNQVNSTAYSLLAPSDWRVTRATETSTPMDPVWADYRAAVRTTANTTRDSIDAAVDVEALQEIVLNIVWPVNPDAPVQQGEVA